jgi:hypothetical protein
LPPARCKKGGQREHSAKSKGVERDQRRENRESTGIKSSKGGGREQEDSKGKGRDESKAGDREGCERTEGAGRRGEV